MSAELVSISISSDYQVIEEFLSEYGDAQSEIESLLLSLEDNPENNDLLDELFRKVHSIKGNSHFLGLHMMTDFVHSLETVLDKLRNGDLTYSKQLGDVILKAVDQIGSYVHNAKQNRSTNVALDSILQSNLTNIDASQNISTKDIDSQNTYTGSWEFSSRSSGSIDSSNEADDQRKQDLILFAEIITQAEQHSLLWKGRTERILRIARDLNRESCYKVDPMQLEAAIYLHDLGKTLLPADESNQICSLTTSDQHSVNVQNIAGATLIEDNPNWEQASEIIMQYREREDGKGFPQGLEGNQICDGAKILAIARTIESIVSRRSDIGDKYPVIHAIREINKNNGTVFSPFWVSIFNRVIRGKNQTN